MAAGVQVKAPSYHSGANDFDFATGVRYNPAAPYINPTAASQSKPTLSTSTRSYSNDSRSAGRSTTPSGSHYKPSSPRKILRPIDTNMSSYTSTTTLPATTSTRTESRHAKLHKRGSSTSSLPGRPSPISGTHSQFTTPFATYEEHFPDVSSTPPPSSTPKIKPYLRKMSSARDDPNQGRLDLSKPVAENAGLAGAGLGIQDFGTRSAIEVAFLPSGRRTPHMRTTSVGSQVSNGSGSVRPNQAFVHPMRQTPLAPTTPTGLSYASSLDGDEARESSDIITDDDFTLGPVTHRNRRSISISSTPQIAPTPLYQTHTASDLGDVPKLTNISTTNLSMKSGRSAKSSKSKLLRSRTDTSRSADFPNSPSSRTSLDKAFSFVSRRSDPDPQHRDERIREARRKFEEKEANKDRKTEKQAIKQRETDEMKEKKQERRRRKSEASERTKVLKPSTKGSDSKKNYRDPEKRSESLRSQSYDQIRHPQIMALPRHGSQAGMIEPIPGRQASSPPSQSGWSRFVRILSCGGER